MYNNFIVETSTKASPLSNKVNIEKAPFLNFCFTGHASTSVGRHFSGMAFFFFLVLAFDIAQKAIKKKIKAFTRE